MREKKREDGEESEDSKGSRCGLNLLDPYSDSWILWG